MALLLSVNGWFGAPTRSACFDARVDPGVDLVTDEGNSFDANLNLLGELPPSSEIVDRRSGEARHLANIVQRDEAGG